MDQQEMDKLIGDIQDYLKNGGNEPCATAPPATAVEEQDLSDGHFIAKESRRRLPKILALNRISSYVLEVLTIALFTAGVLYPSQSWPKTLMFLLGVLLFGVFAIIILMSHQARIQLLLKIEQNTQAIAASKARIAKALERIRIE